MVVLYARSYWRSDSALLYSMDDSSVAGFCDALYSDKGNISYDHIRYGDVRRFPRFLTDSKPAVVNAARLKGVIARIRASGYYLFGFGYCVSPSSTLRSGYRPGSFGIFVPHWFLAVMFALIPISWLLKKRRDKLRALQPLFNLRLRPPRHPRPLPRMRHVRTQSITVMRPLVPITQKCSQSPSPPVIS